MLHLPCCASHSPSSHDSSDKKSVPSMLHTSSTSRALQVVVLGTQTCSLQAPASLLHSPALAHVSTATYCPISSHYSSTVSLHL